MATRGRHGIVAAEAAEDMRAALAAADKVPTEIRRLLHDTAADQLSTAWGEELAKPAAYSNAQSTFVRQGAHADPFGAGITLTTGDADLSRPFEFGSKNREKRITYQQRMGKNKKTRFVTRHVSRQMPPFKATGWIAYPAARGAGRRVMAMWAQIAAKVSHDWLEGKL